MYGGRHERVWIRMMVEVVEAELMRSSHGCDHWTRR
jgi:hypothetical protein